MTNSPTFIAEFSDGQTTCMTVFTSLKKLETTKRPQLVEPPPLDDPPF
jgi:hypothetical protein